MPPGRTPQESELPAMQPRPPDGHDQLRPVPGHEFRRGQQVRISTQRVRPPPPTGRRLRQHRPPRRLSHPQQPPNPTPTTHTTAVTPNTTVTSRPTLITHTTVTTCTPVLALARPPIAANDYPALYPRQI